MQIGASICKSVLRYANRCSDMQIGAPICKSVLLYANRCSDMRSCQWRNFFFRLSEFLRHLDVSAPACTNGVWPPLRPVSVAQNKPSTMSSSSVQSIDPPRTTRSQGTGRWDNRMAAQHLPRYLGGLAVDKRTRSNESGVTDGGGQECAPPPLAGKM